jgi:NADH-quinone oxidoreductase subunit L
MSQHLYLIPLLPFFGFLINGFFGKRTSHSAGVIASTAVGLSFVLSLIAFSELLALAPEMRVINPEYYTWVAAGDLVVKLGMLLDPLSGVMILIVTGVSTLIHIYSIGYMHGDAGYSRYFAYLNLFVFFMLLLVLGDSYPIMFVGWEGVGLCSYLLIGFWFTDKAKADAGKKAFIVNRVGDFGFLIGVFLIFTTFGTLSFAGVAEGVKAFTGSATVFFWITLALFLGATGKSAQIPLYTWLPDAMAGPTPVSALIHAATMVTAGVYMVARNSFLFVMAPEVLSIVAWIGVLTAIFAATIALVQNDIKKVLAYSTVSQLGYMFVGCGVGAFAAGISHLMTHAFFKALLFLGSGSVIHAIHHAHSHAGFHGDPQDIRYMGGLKNKMPTTYWTFLIACLAIGGIPGLSGFFSKDEIIWKSFANGHTAVGIVAIIAAGLTAFYMFRLLFLTFFGEWRGGKGQFDHVHESPKVMTFPLQVLGVLSIIGGWIMIPHALGGHMEFETFLEPSFRVANELVAGGEAAHHSLSMEYLVMGISVAVALAGILWARAWYINNPEAPKRLAARYKTLHKAALNKWYVDEIYDFTFVETTRGLADGAWNWFDRPVVDGAVNGTAKVIEGFSSVLKRIQTGLVSNYAMMMALGVVAIMGWMVMR